MLNLNSRRNNIIHVIIILNILLYCLISIVLNLFNLNIRPDYILVTNAIFTTLYFITLKKIINPKNVNLQSLESTQEIELISYTNYGFLVIPVHWTKNAKIFIDDNRFYFYYNLSCLSKYFYGPFSIGFNNDENSTYNLDTFENNGNHVTFSFSNKNIYSKFKIKLRVKNIDDLRILNEIGAKFLSKNST